MCAHGWPHEGRQREDRARVRQDDRKGRQELDIGGVITHRGKAADSTSHEHAVTGWPSGIGQASIAQARIPGGVSGWGVGCIAARVAPLGRKMRTGEQEQEKRDKKDKRSTMAFRYIFIKPASGNWAAPSLDGVN